MAISKQTFQRDVSVPFADVTLAGELLIPVKATGVVLFAHGSGSSRHSPRNQFVAEALHRAGLATLLFDLLTEREEYEERFTGQLRFDIGLLAKRLVGATDWLHQAHPDFAIGYFGSSTGGGAALVAAAQSPLRIAAIVSRGGRPDLAGPALARVQAPTLLIVGGEDLPVIEMNRDAFAQINCEKDFRIIPGTTHLFEEPGTLEQVADMAAEWFVGHFGAAAAIQRPEQG